ncbi:hypothetical protein L1049_024806 [Liquidambar formosana]|uniref:Myb/SANT-like domain-containing protein n=1 Tax=Liquidambar formosana TaxID=63359 RepID=A0AAP0X1J0_LIQFO
MASQADKGKAKAKVSDSEKGKAKANWDPKAHEIFIDICIAEVRLGNRSGTHFTTVGWKNVVEKFNAATNRDYNRIQLKNHWDLMKKKWQLWEAFMLPEATKFCVKGLEHAFKLDELFMDVVAIGARAWAPTSYQMPPLYQQSNRVEDEIDVEDGNDSEGDNIKNTSSLTSLDNDRKRAMSERGGKQNKTKKKVVRAAKLERQLDRICDAVENRNSTASILHTNKPGCSIEEVMTVMGAMPECPPGSELYIIGVRLFKLGDNREIFKFLPNDEIKISWLKQEALYLPKPSN